MKTKLKAGFKPVTSRDGRYISPGFTPPSKAKKLPIHRRRPGRPRGDLKVRINANVTPALESELVDFAVYHGITYGEVVERALVAYFKSQPTKTK